MKVNDTKKIKLKKNTQQSLNIPLFDVSRNAAQDVQCLKIGKMGKLSDDFS